MDELSIGCRVVRVGTETATGKPGRFRRQFGDLVLVVADQNGKPGRPVVLPAVDSEALLGLAVRVPQRFNPVVVVGDGWRLPVTIYATHRTRQRTGELTLILDSWIRWRLRRLSLKQRKGDKSIAQWFQQLGVREPLAWKLAMSLEGIAQFSE